MVAGLLLTSMGSGVLVSRTGRYTIFPVVGTAVMAVGFVAATAIFVLAIVIDTLIMFGGKLLTPWTRATQTVRVKAAAT